jgi:hypothetical protein
MTTTTTRPAHLSAVRIGKGTAVHAGHLSTYGTNDAPRYIPLCPAGAPRFRADDSPAVPAHGAPLADQVTCRNCVARYAHAVGTIHAAQDAAHAAPEPAPVPVHPASINSADGMHDGPAAAAFVWGIIVGTPGRLRAAWVNAAQRRVHGLPDVAHDGRSADADVAYACEADTRDSDSLAREYLAAYAAIIDDRADAVDRAATRYAAPDDAAQESTGTRPPAGAMVTVEGHTGRWEILPRSAEEQRRHPHHVRVRQEGHTFNGSVPLDAVTVCPPDTANPADGPRFAGQAGQTGVGQDASVAGSDPSDSTRGAAMTAIDTTVIRPNALALVEVYTFFSGVSSVRHLESTGELLGRLNITANGDTTGLELLGDDGTPSGVLNYVYATNELIDGRPSVDGWTDGPDGRENVRWAITY